MTDIERSLTYLEAQVKYLMQRDAERDQAKRMPMEIIEPAPVRHWSDCATNSEPAYPAGECDCGGYDPVAVAAASNMKANALRQLDIGLRVESLTDDEWLLLARAALGAIPSTRHCLVKALSEEERRELALKQGNYGDGPYYASLSTIHDLLGPVKS